MTGGRKDTDLVGLPHLFKRKGYETVFTTGCTIRYDQWDIFLPAHGFEQVWGEPEFIQFGMSDLHISKEEWKNTKRSLSWGVHDDISFEVLGNLMINKTIAQKARVAKKEPKKPFFLTHYTISSHGPFNQYPDWYRTVAKPDFSMLSKGKGFPNVIKNYNEMRYFTDVELGKFLDRMEAEGILKDSIVVVTGDHRQSPEYGMSPFVDDQVATTRVPTVIIAEGRLGKYAGTLIDDTSQHYDLLNTLADIIGVPAGGFFQGGVGRSLMRKDVAKSRPVWSNVSLKKKSVVHGTKRFAYDLVLNGVTLHDADTDPYMTVDLFPSLTPKQQDEWLDLRESGRHLNNYFKQSWDDKCISKVKC